MIEAQVRYTMNCLKLMKRRNQRVLEVRPEIQQSFVEEIYRRMAGTVCNPAAARVGIRTNPPRNHHALARLRRFLPPPHAFRLAL